MCPKNLFFLISLLLLLALTSNQTDAGTVGITGFLDEYYDATNRRAIPAVMPENGTIESITMWYAGGSTGDLITPVYVVSGTKIWFAWLYEDLLDFRVGLTTLEWGRAKTDPAKTWADTPRMPSTFGSVDISEPWTTATPSPGS